MPCQHCRSNRVVIRIRSPYAARALAPAVQHRMAGITGADGKQPHLRKPPKLKLRPGATP